MYSTRYSCQILVNLTFSRNVFEKFSNIKFHENSYIGSPVVPRTQTDTDGRMDGRKNHDEANSRFSQNYEKRLIKAQEKLDTTCKQNAP